MAVDLSQVEFPDDIKVRIHEIAIKHGWTDEEVVAHRLRAFFELVDDMENNEVPGLVERVRQALAEDSDAKNN
jgi:hypothetical protein